MRRFRLFCDSTAVTVQYVGGLVQQNKLLLLTVYSRRKMEKYFLLSIVPAVIVVLGVGPQLASWQQDFPVLQIV